jgi:hypothetical protein
MNELIEKYVLNITKLFTFKRHLILNAVLCICFSFLKE